jgi:LmbE family N-acetylglucosaminyl deacetylase
MTGLRLDKRTDAPRSILCLGAHADDIEIGCGGTLLKLIDDYADVGVHWVVFSASPRRKKEALESADRFLDKADRKKVDVLNFQDGYFPFEGSAIKERVQELSRRDSPDLVFTHHRNDRHQDHRLVSELTWEAFRNHLILEYEIPKYDGDLGQPNVFVPLDEATGRQKVEGLMDGFESQQGKPWFSGDTFWSMLRLRGIECRRQYAEAFHGRKVLFQ